MIPLVIEIDGDNAWADLRDDPDRVIGAVETFRIARLARGMTSGATSVAIRIDLPDGKVVIAQTSLKLLSAAVSAFQARDVAEREGE